LAAEPTLTDLDAGRRISVELGTQMQLEFESIKGRFNSTVVGMDPPAYLILKPSGDASRVAAKLYKGNTVVVRYIHAGSVYGFQSTTLGTIAEPVRLVFIAYPKIVAEHNIRTDKRIECVLPATVTVGEEALEAVILDVSQGGCRLSLSEPPADSGIRVGSELAIAFALPGIEGRLEVEGKVRNVRQDERGLELGVQFEPLDETTREKLCKQYIDALHDRLF